MPATDADRWTLADEVRHMMHSASPSQGPLDRLIERRLATYGDDTPVTLRAGDIRTALRAARGESA